MLTFTSTIEPSAQSNQSSQAGRNNYSELGFDYDFAFQPIVDIRTQTIFAHEALVRGCNGSGATTVLSKVNNGYLFDQASRVKAIKTACEANIEGLLSINFMPNTVYNPALSLLTTIETCFNNNFPTENIIFEFNEQELVEDPMHISNIGRAYKKLGFKTALDDFGAGYAGLNFIANFQPDMIKIDMNLIRDIDKSKSRQTIIKAVVRMCEELGVIIIAEGIETVEEKTLLSDYGIYLFQGYLFCKPSFKSMGRINQSAWH